MERWSNVLQAHIGIFLVLGLQLIVVYAPLVTTVLLKLKHLSNAQLVTTVQCPLSNQYHVLQEPLVPVKVSEN